MRMPAGGYFFDGDWLSDWGSGTEDERIALYAREAERIYKETEYATNLVGYSHGLGFNSYGAGSISDAILAYDDSAGLHERREKALASSIQRMGRVLRSEAKKSGHVEQGGCMRRLTARLIPNALNTRPPLWSETWTISRRNSRANTTRLPEISIRTTNPCRAVACRLAPLNWPPST
jgi:hypothetical protein